MKMHTLPKLLAAITLGASLFAAGAASASVITSLSGGTSVVLPASNLFSAGPISGSGYTYTSTYGSSVYGWTSGYGLDQNGYWDSGLGLPYLGLNTGNGSMTITFDSAVSSVLAFLNYARSGSNGYDGGPASIAVYDASNNLIESFGLSFSTIGNNQGFDFGFSEGSAIIKSIVFTNAYIVAANLRTSAATVPEPGVLGLLGLGSLGLIATARRKRQSA